MKNVVFYSKYKQDTNSPQLLAMMKNTPFAREFVYFCIDPDPVTKKRNKDLLTILEVTEVPTMYVDGQMYVGDDAIRWLQIQLQQLQGAYREQQDPYAGQYRQQQDPYAGQYQPQQQPMQSQYPGGQMPQNMMPGMGGAPQMGGFPGGGRLPPGIGSNMDAGPQLPGVGFAGSGEGPGGLMGGSGGDSGFAPLSMPPSLTPGLNSGQMSPQQLLTPIQTKGNENGGGMDRALEQFAASRDAEQNSMMPQQPPGGMQGFRPPAGLQAGGVSGFGGGGGLPPQQMMGQMQQMMR